jgi:arylsulfatase A-like enzyme/preprotein translocase subunit SecE
MSSLFRQLFQLIFTGFSLYLLGDAFSRWDGFRQYASFPEFLPSVALVLILWSIAAIFVTVIIWIVLKAFEWFRCRTGLKVKTEHLLFLSGGFVLFGGLVWKVKKVIWPNVETTLQIKVIVFICVVLLTVFFTVSTRKRSVQWLSIIRERITPLVWIFGILVFLSVPLVAYHAWIKDTGSIISERTKQPYGILSNRPNIILLTFDALAAREMSKYGYCKKTTPFIDTWAEKATVFTKAQAGSNFTASSTASLMTGKRVWTHQTYHIEGGKPIRSEDESLPSVLKEHGYFNIALVVNPFASVRILGMSESFDLAPPATEFSSSASLFGWKFGIVDVMLYRAFGDKIRLHNWILKNDFIFSKFFNLVSRNIFQTTVPPEIVFNRFLEILDSDLPRPFFAWIHVFPPHDPYLPPESFMGELNPSSELRAYKGQEKLIEESYKYLFQYQPVPKKMQPAVELMREYYDEFITYIDKQFGDFIEELNKRGIENTRIILSADHGESFEHGYFTHGGPFLYEQVTHIPLIIKEHGQIKGRTVDTLVEQIDIPATVLDLANVPVPSWMEGRSLMPLIRGKSIVPKPAFSMNLESNPSRGHQITTGSVAVWKGDYKLIHYLEKGESLLFNLKRDPEELNNLFSSNPEVGQHLLYLINYNLKEANGKIKSGN